mgnify:FL=1
MIKAGNKYGLKEVALLTAFFILLFSFTGKSFGFKTELKNSTKEFSGLIQNKKAILNPTNQVVKCNQPIISLYRMNIISHSSFDREINLRMKQLKKTNLTLKPKISLRLYLRVLQPDEEPLA